LPNARSLQAAIKNKLGKSAELIAGHNGIFKVELDGRTIFDKSNTGRFPEDQEIINAIDSA
jgi:selT/selW/selH-like putative selenoprotein